MIDESAHKVFDCGMKDWHGPCAHKCSRCGRQLDIYYCESRLYLVRCKHCKIVSLVEAGNPNEAAEKVSHRAAPENKPLTLEQLRQMDEEPVWVGEKDKRSRIGHYGLVDTVRERVIFNRSTYTTFKVVAGKTAYARRPEDAP